MATRRAVKSSRTKIARQSSRQVTEKHSAKRRPTSKKRTHSGSRGRAHSATKVAPPKAPSKAAAAAPANDTKAFPDDPRLDRRIIEGMLHDRTQLMEEMAQRGFTDTAVVRRAAELGLSEALIRQVRGVAADLAGERPAGRRATPHTLGARTCLSCDRVFLSSGPGNRLCMRCRGGDAGLAQL